MAQTAILNENGQTFQGVGVYASANASALAGTNPVTQPAILLIGSSVGGQPGVPIALTSPSVAKSTFKSGDLVDAYNFAARHGAQTIYGYRVDPATQASVTFYGSSGQAALVLTTNDYGNYTNSFSAGLSGSAGNITATLRDAYDQISLTSPSLGKVATLTYTGNATSALLTVVQSMQQPTNVSLNTDTTGGFLSDSTNVEVVIVPVNASGIGPASGEETLETGSSTSTNTVSVTWSAVLGAASYNVYVNGLMLANTTATSYTIANLPASTAAALPTETTDGPNLTVTLSGQTDSSQNLNISLASASVQNISSLVAFISAQTGYSITAVSGQQAVLSAQLDSVSNQSIANNTSYTLTADAATVANWFTQTNLVTATLPNGVSTLPAIAGPIPFTGGSDGTQTLTDWANAANIIATSNAPIMRYPVALTGGEPGMSAGFKQQVIQSILAAAALQSDTLSIGFFGGGVSYTDAQAQADAVALNSPRAIQCGPDFYDYNSLGAYTHFPAYMMGACFAGLAAADSPSQPLTGKGILVNALGGVNAQGQPVNKARALALALAGVSYVYASHKGLTIYQGVTTDQLYADQTNTYKVEFSVHNQVDATRIYVIQKLDALYTGGRNFGQVSTTSFLSELNGALEECVKFQWIASYEPATQVTLASSNSTFFITNAQLYVINPINGAFIAFGLALPSTVASQVA